MSKAILLFCYAELRANNKNVVIFKGIIEFERHFLIVFKQFKFGT